MFSHRAWVDLLIVQLKTAIRRLLDNKGVRGRVLDKVNRYGEVVIGVILERPPPPRLMQDEPEQREHGEHSADGNKDEDAAPAILEEGSGEGRPKR
jgi:hypothetical protein